MREEEEEEEDVVSNVNDPFIFCGLTHMLLSSFSIMRHFRVPGPIQDIQQCASALKYGGLPPVCIAAMKLEKRLGRQRCMFFQNAFVER